MTTLGADQDQYLQKADLTSLRWVEWHLSNAILSVKTYLQTKRPTRVVNENYVVHLLAFAGYAFLHVSESAKAGSRKDQEKPGEGLMTLLIAAFGALLSSRQSNRLYKSENPAGEAMQRNEHVAASTRHSSASILVISITAHMRI